jgi:predicted O-methyltransferase YrrM
MASGKRIPTKLHEFKRLIRDLRVDSQLGSEHGRRQLWEEIGRECHQDSMCALLESTLGLEGDVIECGVYRGASLVRLAHTLHEHAPHKTLYGLDSFQGFPEENVDVCDVGPQRSLSGIKGKFRFCADTPERLERIFQTYGVRAELAPGYFVDTLPRFASHRFCFVHLDVDLYASYKECLEALYDRLTPGGVIVFDEWNFDAWPGSTRAIKEFLEGRPEVVETCEQREQPSYFIRKVAVSAARAA